MIIASELDSNRSELSIICNISEIESALLVHSSLFLLSSSVDSLVGSYRLYVFLWKRGVTTQVMSMHGESEDHPGFVLVLEFCQIIGIPKAICLEILASKCTCNVCKIDKIGAIFVCICHLINISLVCFFFWCILLWIIFLFTLVF